VGNCLEHFFFCFSVCEQKFPQLFAMFHRVDERIRPKMVKHPKNDDDDDERYSGIPDDVIKYDTPIMINRL
jgi:hypothetical protein